VRDRIGREAYQTNVAGLNFGYFYAESPIIAYDGEPAPAYTVDDYKQSISGHRF
jgi:hypothetical protein